VLMLAWVLPCKLGRSVTQKKLGQSPAFFCESILETA
jgi:hypothetical protein